MKLESYEQFIDLLAQARERGWVSDIVCSTHLGPPLTEEEDEEFIDGHDPCIFVARVYEEGPHEHA